MTQNSPLLPTGAAVTEYTSLISCMKSALRLMPFSNQVPV